MVKSSGASTSPELADDGTPATLWMAAEKGKPWLEFDFGAVHKITRYVIRHAGAAGLPRDYNTRNFMVQASVNRRSWTTLDSVKGNTENVTDVELAPVDARYFRITVTDAGVDRIARFAEVEIFGKKSYISHE